MQSEKRPASRQDVVDFFGRLPPHTMRAVVWEVDGELAAIAGYWQAGGTAVVFSDIRRDLDAPPIRIWREAKDFMATIDVAAICVATEGSESFLTRLGWRHVGTSSDGEIFEWQTLALH